MCSASGIIDLIFGIDKIVEIDGLAVKNGIGLIEEMLRGVLTKSKIKTFPKIVVALGGILIVVTTIEELIGIEVDVVNADVNKIVELYEAFNVQDDDGAVVDNSVAEEVSYSSIDDVFDTSIEVT